MTSPTTIDTVIVGAGFAGLYMLHRLRNQNTGAVILEAGGGIGGTWYWNRYPGARVDIESQEYGYSFSSALDEEWRWSERYAPQSEILSYLEHVAKKFDLKRDIRFNTRVTAAHWNEQAKRWHVITDKGDNFAARALIMATGCLSIPKDPDFPGVGDFQGKSYFTSRWPHEEVNFTGQNVAVIGTGSSAVQSIPVIAKQAKHLTVFQRTPNYTVPAHNHAADPAIEELWKLNRPRFRSQALANNSGVRQIDPQDRLLSATPPNEVEQIFEERWKRGGFAVLGGFADTGIDESSNKVAHEFFARKIKSIVKDPKVADLLTPKTYPVGTKRLCVDIGYWETYNRPNVTLIDVSKAPIERITKSGIRTASGEHAFDVIVYAIGFDAMTGALTKIDLVGKNGLKIKDKWAYGPKTYLGLTIAGFPNLFTITGPQSPSVLTNMPPSIEHHVDWIARALSDLDARKKQTLEATEAAEEAWIAHVNELGAMTLMAKANSWYMGANIPGKPRTFLPYVGGVPAYRQKCAEVVANGYEGFVLG
ncbi:MAG: NAD(P)/FAD-dependent oxidoreductase [Alphaproteobacteria bacterium]|nr:NAD(P)/FAD-dependent oxidoreductase [Alphaproteobacteria bacterium]